MRSSIWAGVLAISFLGGGAIVAAEPTLSSTPMQTAGSGITSPSAASFVSAPIVLCQYSDSSSSSSSSGSRSYRGVIRLGVFAIIMVVSGVGWLIRKMAS